MRSGPCDHAVVLGWYFFLLAAKATLSTIRSCGEVHAESPTKPLDGRTRTKFRSLDADVVSLEGFTQRSGMDHLAVSLELTMISQHNIRSSKALL